jgi:plasmid stabilization system protein ParE
MPERYTEIYKDYRRTLVKNYSIFYKIDENKKEVIIYRILHQAQNFKKYLK